MNIIQELSQKGLITPPKWLPDNVMYVTIMGSTAYGVSTDNSDYDLYGFCVPPKDVVFPHLTGHISGFGKPYKPFSQYQQHHIVDPSANAGKGREYDITIYSIVKYFQLCMENNPNMVDSLFTPENCVLTRTPIWDKVKRNRRLFLHKGCFHKFRGYAYAQLHKIDSKKPTGKRKEIVDEFGYDVKYAYHLVRLSLECEEILERHTLDLQRNREILKSIRRGEWELEDIKRWFTDKEAYLENLYSTSTLQHSPDEDAIRDLLLDCLKMHYGDLSSAIVVPGKERRALEQIMEIAHGGLT